MECAISNKWNTNLSCFSDIQIVEICKAYNKYTQGKLCFNKKCIHPKEIKITTNFEDNYKQLYNRLKSLDKKENKWILMDFIENIPSKKIKEQIYKYTFKPIGERLLTTSTINNVFNQIQKTKTFPNFKYYGTLPSDFFTLYPSELETINNELLKKKGYVSIVFNLDKHNEKGSHWVVVFIDIKKKQIEYFDSLGKPSISYIKRFILYVVDKHQFNFIWNKVKHQKQNTECGVYCIFFIIHRLLGYSFEYFQLLNLNDNYIKKYRNILFST